MSTSKTYPPVYATTQNVSPAPTKKKARKKGLNNKQLVNEAEYLKKELWKSRRVLSVEAVGRGG